MGYVACMKYCPSAELQFMLNQSMSVYEWIKSKIYSLFIYYAQYI